MKVAIVGSRSISSVDIGGHLAGLGEVSAIVSGGARGVDTLAAGYARSHGLELIEFLPDYARYGRRAPLVRNIQIVEAADVVIAFWDGRSRGTAYTIREARKRGKEVRVVMHS